MNIAIIGAGIAGLTAAQQLQKLGHQVIVFEKSRGRGGRLCSKRLQWQETETSLDIGAQYFTARDPRFVAATEQWLSAGVVQPWQFDPHVYKGGVLSPSADDQIRYVGVPGMNSIAHHLSQGISIRRETRITRVEKADDEWLLFDEKGYCYQHFDWLFVSAPARQTFDLINGVSDLTDAIPVNSLRPCWALALQIEQRTPADVQGIFSDDKVRWASKLSSRPQRQSTAEQWMLHFNPGWSESQGKAIQEKLPGIGLAWLQSVFDQSLTLTQSHSHYWAYASIADNHSVADVVWMDRQQHLSLLGDWTQAGRIEGAWVSAISAVENFVALTGS
ncbi:MAG: FAD-dependent oxidoreductase [Candidatus Pelagadaptatus aseana]|uniref:NAD(P)/FAD-dependent oxidoreductase n=1 Tax=Candidatus Pelagadaptatus aseana TaxID=3120508 RepID=UPI0039B27E3D